MMKNQVKKKVRTGRFDTVSVWEYLISSFDIINIIIMLYRWKIIHSSKCTCILFVRIIFVKQIKILRCEFLCVIYYCQCQCFSEIICFRVLNHMKKNNLYIKVCNTQSIKTSLFGWSATSSSICIVAVCLTRFALTFGIKDCWYFVLLKESQFDKMYIWNAHLSVIVNGSANFIVSSQASVKHSSTYGSLSVCLASVCPVVTLSW